MTPADAAASLAAENGGPYDTFRIISAAYPAVDLYDDLDVDPALWPLLHDLEGITNSRLREERGETHLVAQDERPTGPGSSFVLAPFTHANPDGSRFSDGVFGVYYCAEAEETAAREVAYHRALFMRYTNEPAQALAMRTVGAVLAGIMFDIADKPWSWLRSDEYGECRAFGALARERVAFLRYESVRHAAHAAFAVFTPRALQNARHVRFLEFFWDGARIAHYSEVRSIF